MKLIVGLGNPGKEYLNTRHNVGFMCLDNFAREHELDIEKKKYDGLFVKTSLYGEDVILLKPQKYMNLSGEVVKRFVDYFKIDINDVLVVSDDLDIPVGKIRLRYKGSSGGHNGLKNIEQNIKTEEYKRLRIGISNDKAIDTKDYVLGDFSTSEKEVIEETIKKSSLILKDFITENFDVVMNKYN